MTRQSYDCQLFRNTPVARTALPPVIILPISCFAFKEKVGWQAIVGTILAIAGVAVLFLA
jgi:drug/metabolite transporter (DMT)-like permease